MRKKPPFFARMVRGIIIFIIACLMVLFFWPWLFFPNNRQIMSIPFIKCRQRWTKEERVDRLADYGKIQQ